MSYEVPKGKIDFRLEGAPYLTNTSSVVNFSGKPSLIFVPPPAITITSAAAWQAGSDQQAQYSCRHENSLPIQTSRQQSSQQARVLEAPKIGLFWSQVTKKEIKACFSHGTGKERAGQSGDQWKQAEAKEAHQENLWDNSIQPQDESTGDVWNTPPQRNQFLSEAMQSVDLYGTSSRLVDMFIHSTP